MEKVSSENELEIKKICGHSNNNARATTCYDYLSQERELFEASFMSSYTKIPEVKTRFSTDEALLKFIREAFDEEVRDYIEANDESIRFYRAILNQQVVGYLSVEVEDKNKIYMRQLAVSHEHQRLGIGRALFRFVVQNDLKMCEAVSVSCRKWNYNAIKFYRSIGFKDEDTCHPSLDSNEYKGMLWKRLSGALP